jgi:hypothetical protein
MPALKDLKTVKKLPAKRRKKGIAYRKTGEGIAVSGWRKQHAPLPSTNNFQTSAQTNTIPFSPPNINLNPPITSPKLETCREDDSNFAFLIG